MIKKFYVIHIQFVLLSILLICINATAQTPQYNTTPITAGSNSFPFNSATNKCQFLYNPADFSSSPLSGNITTVYIRTATASTATYAEFTFKMGYTNLTSFTTGSGVPFETGLTTVYYASSIALTSVVDGWLQITLQTPFFYSGTQNIIFEASMTSTSGLNIRYNSITGTNHRLHGPVASSTGTGNTGQLTLGFDILQNPCTAPPTPGNATTSSSSACSGSAVSLNVTGNSSGIGQTYVWESSATQGGTYSSISSSSTSSSLNINPTTTMWYRVGVTCSGNTAYSAPVQITVTLPVAGGTFTINSGAATGGTNFQTFTDAVNYLKCGITGPVVFNVNAGSGPYNEQITIPQISGTSAVNTITFNGNGQMLSFNSTTSTARAVITLNGADFITINNLVIDGSAGTYGWGVFFTNQADNNTVSSCTILTSTTNITNTNHCPIVMSGSYSSVATGNNGNFNNIIGNTLIGGYYTVALYGNSAAGMQNMNNVLSNNTIQDSYSYSIYVLYQSGVVINRNNISRPTRTSSTTTAGLYFSTGNINGLVDKNRVHDMFGGFATPSTSTIYCFYVAADGSAGQENKFINNLVYNINSNGTIYGIYNTTAPYMRAYHNTIVLDDQSTTTGAAYGFYQTGAAAGLDYRNNIIYLTRAGTGIKRCIYFVTTTSTIISNNNDLFLNSSGGTNNNVGQWGATNYATLTDWKTANANAFDQQSLELDPMFVNPGAGDYNPANSQLDNKGTPVGVTLDIEGTPRSATIPDIGAYEFSTLTAGLNMAAEGLITPSISLSGCYNANEIVTIRIRNSSTNTVDFSVNPVTITTNITGAVTLVRTAVINSGTLGSDQSMNVPMSLALDMSAQGVYTFNASVSVTGGDVNPANDAMPAQNRTKVILSSGTPVATPDSYCVTGGTPIFTATGATGYSGLQWQQSATSGSGYTNIPGGTTSPFTVPGTVSQTMYYLLTTTCGSGTATSSEFSVIFYNPQVTSTTPGNRCGPGTVALSATGSPGTVLNWFAAASGGSPLATGGSFTTTVISSTTDYWVSAANTGGSSGTAPMPVQASIFTGNVRGYWFAAPIGFKITGLNDLGTGTGSQSIAVVRFDPSVTPPTFSATTNAFTTLFLTQNNPATGVILVNIQINAGDVIGILGQRGTTTSYGSPNPYTTTIAGQSVALSRMGMQFPLTTTAPQDLWQEPSSTTIGRTEITYETGCEGNRTKVTATINPGYSLAGTVGGAQVCTNADVGSGNTYMDGSCNSIASITPNGASPVSGLINACVKIDATVQSYNLTPYVQRHYDLEPANNPAGATARVTLYFTQQEFNNYNAAAVGYPLLPTSSTDNIGKYNLKVTQYHGTGTAPGNYSGGVVLIDPVDADIVYNPAAARWEVSFNATGFSGFYVHAGFQVLPVTLINFTAKRSGSVNELNWSTSQELNSSHFIIERSIDGINFGEIGQVMASGNSGSVRNYHFTDLLPQKGINYYRIRMVDIDSKSRNSIVAAVRNTGVSVIDIYPNPVKDMVRVDVDADKSGKGAMTIMDVSGKKVYERKFTVGDGSNIFNIDVSNMASGTYIIKVVLDEQSLVKKFTKL